MMSKFLKYLCVSLLLVLLLTVAVSAAEPAVVEEGTCGADGDNLTWILYDNGQLVISGTGAMEDFLNDPGGSWAQVFSDDSAMEDPLSRDGSRYIFWTYYFVTSVIIEEGVTSIGSCAFMDCSDLSSVTIPNTVTTIENAAFFGCHNLSDITLPDSVTNIGEFAFERCSNLTELTIGTGITSIEYATFRNCSSIVSITIPDGVTTIDSSAFDGCSSLTNVYYGGTEADRQNMTIDTYMNSPLLDATWHYIILGDVNEDGLVNNPDVIRLARSLIGLEILTDHQKPAADVNRDGLVNNSDVIKIARCVIGLEPLSQTLDAVDTYGRLSTVTVHTNASGHTEYGEILLRKPDYYYTHTAPLNEALTEEINSAVPYQIVIFSDGKLQDDSDSIGANCDTAEWDEDAAKYVLTETFEDKLAAFTGNGVETFIYVDEEHYQILIAAIHTYIDYFEDAEGGLCLYRISDADPFRLLGSEYMDTIAVNGESQTVSRRNYAVSYAQQPVLLQAPEQKIIGAKSTVTSKEANAFANASVTDYYGNRYFYSHTAGSLTLDNMQSRPIGENEIRKKVKVFLDQFGYIICWTDQIDMDLDYSVAFFIEHSWKLKYLGEAEGYAYFHQYADFDGQINELEIDYDFFKDLRDLPGALLAYRYDEVLDCFEYVCAETADTLLNVSTGEITAGVRGTSDTNYLVRNFDYEKEAYVYDVFKGWKALHEAYPDGVVTSISSAYAPVQWLPVFDEETMQPDYTLASYVFIDASNSIPNVNDENSNTFFVLNYEGTLSGSDLYPDDSLSQDFQNYDFYKAIIGSEEGYIAMSPTAELLNIGLYCYETLEVLGTLEDGKPLYCAASCAPAEDLLLDSISRLDSYQLMYTRNGQSSMAILSDTIDIFLIYVDRSGNFDSYEHYDNAEDFNDDRYFEWSDLQSAYAEFDSDSNGVVRLYLVVE